MLAFRESRTAGPDPQLVAIEALSFIAADPELMNRFLDLTGLRVDELRAAAGGPGFLLGVLDFILAHEPTLIAFSQNSAIEPERIQIARDRMDGAPAG